MTKKLSILSIVVVLLFSMCFVGCGDDSVSPDDYSKMIVGKWKLVEIIDRDGRTSTKPNLKDYYTFKDDGTCIFNSSNGDNENGNYQLSRSTSEIMIDVGKFEKNKWVRIIKFTKNHLEISFEDTYVFDKQ